MSNTFYGSPMHVESRSLSSQKNSIILFDKVLNTSLDNILKPSNLETSFSQDISKIVQHEYISGNLICKLFSARRLLYLHTFSEASLKLRLKWKLSKAHLNDFNFISVNSFSYLSRRLILSCLVVTKRYTYLNNTAAKSFRFI